MGIAVEKKQREKEQVVLYTLKTNHADAHPEINSNPISHRIVLSCLIHFRTYKVVNPPPRFVRRSQTEIWLSTVDMKCAGRCITNRSWYLFRRWCRK
jgi:hypothetical protein